MSPIIRRVRGVFLRVSFNSRLAGAIGGLLLAPAVLVFAGDYAWETWITDGLGLVMGATGVALVLAGLGGRRPDWIDPDDHRPGTAA